MTAHPAKFSKGFVEIFRNLLNAHLAQPRRWETPLVLDPFAGIGTIHQLRPEFATFGVEIEHEWAATNEHTYCGDSRELPDHWTDFFDAIVTSPTYGNRMADHHIATDASKRNTYTHTLGRQLTDGNSGKMQWGEDYRNLHVAVYEECKRVLVPGGIVIVNVSDHIRKGEVIPVSQWHSDQLHKLGLQSIIQVSVETPRQRHGANGDLRVDRELILVFQKPEGEISAE